MSRLQLLTMLCAVTCLVGEGTRGIQITTSERLSQRGDRATQTQRVLLNGQVRVTASRVIKVASGHTTYRTLKITAPADATLIQIENAAAASRTQFYLVADQCVFAQCDLDNDGLFEVLVLYTDGRPQAAVHQGPDGLLAEVTGELWEIVKMIAQAGSAREASGPE